MFCVLVHASAHDSHCAFSCLFFFFFLSCDAHACNTHITHITGEDVIHCFGAVQRALQRRHSSGELPLSVPDAAKTLARCIYLDRAQVQVVYCMSIAWSALSAVLVPAYFPCSLSTHSMRFLPLFVANTQANVITGQLTLSRSAIFTHAPLPQDWFSSDEAATAEGVDFCKVRYVCMQLWLCA